MTESQWLRSRDPDLMQEYLRRQGIGTDRHFRLFGCACCRRLWDRLHDPRNRHAVAVAERLADGDAHPEELVAAKAAAHAGVAVARAAFEAARDAILPAASEYTARRSGEPGGAWLAACATLHNTTRAPAWKAALNAADNAVEALAWVAAGTVTGRVAPDPDDLDVSATWNVARKSAQTQEEAEQAALLRHIFGNPFQPWPAPLRYSPIIVTLAEALYAGEDCAFALADALEEAGEGELAEHFRAPDHPRGCWVLDRILGKT
jgi:hypothetical protein